jgi:pyruvate dehydrogenase E2 component (dihydrolipoamide acetyltransferase)
MSVRTDTTITMPMLSEGMEEGTIVRWLVADGDPVTVGQPIVEVETDKATTELEADAEGLLWHRATEGDTVVVGAEVAVIGAERPSEAVRAEGTSPRPVASAMPAAPVGREPEARAVVGAGRRQIASPLARRIAAELGVDLASLRGTGLAGRIVRADVLAAAQARDGRASVNGAEPAAQIGVPARGHAEEVTATRVQLRIAERMVQAKSEIPDFAISMTVDMAPALQLRASLREHAERAGMRAPSVNDMVVKACALALREHPEANSSFTDGRFDRHGRVNVGVAVATDGSLLVPTIFDADERSLGSIAEETRRLAGAVRDGSVTAAELAGGTFTVSNLGMFGVTEFTAVVNPPQAAILAVGAVEEAAVVVDGAVTVGRRMKITLTSDHRILYGATAAAFLGRVRELLERPWAIVL